MSTTLYDLTNQYKQLLDLAEEVDSSAFQDALEHLEDSINEKAENIAFVLQEMKADIEVLKAEEKRLKDRRMTLEKKQEHLRWYLQSELEGAGIEKVKSTHFTISVHNNAPKVQILDEEKVPVEFMIPKFTIDKKALKEALDNGLEIEGVTLVQEKGLSIR